MLSTNEEGKFCTARHIAMLGSIPCLMALPRETFKMSVAIALEFVIL